LTQYFGKERVFMDVCDIEPGVDFVTAWKPNGWWSGYLDLTVMFPTTKKLPTITDLERPDHADPGAKKDCFPS